MKTFYFNTGVQPYKYNPPVKLGPGQIIRGGTMQIPFDCENVPERAIFMFGNQDDDLPESKHKNVIVREIFNSTLISKYAYFKVLTD